MVINFAEAELNDVNQGNQLFFKAYAGILEPFFILTFLEEEENCIAVVFVLFECNLNELLNVFCVAFFDKSVQHLHIENCREHSDVLCVPVRKKSDALNEVSSQACILCIFKFFVSNAWIFKARVDFCKSFLCLESVLFVCNSYVFYNKVRCKNLNVNLCDVLEVACEV